MKLTLELHFRKKEGFKEEDFLKVISDNLRGLQITSINYGNIEEGYVFVVEYKPLIPGFSYQPILGCFGGLDREYGYIENLSIPADKMHQE
jgi:hypothetical protein